MAESTLTSEADLRPDRRPGTPPEGAGNDPGGHWSRAGSQCSDGGEAIGIKTAFGSGADFSGISSEPGFAPSDVLHGAFVDVDERGTEAAAATADIMVAAALRPPTPINFLVDRLFLFLLRDRPTGTILFMGRVVDPRQ